VNKKDFNKKFGIYIAKKRRQANLSQSKLASLVGNNAQNISSIERGEVSPTLFWLTKLSKAFEISLTQLIEDFESSK
jgi:putative transcriptional regulator